MRPPEHIPTPYLPQGMDHDAFSLALRAWMKRPEGKGIDEAMRLARGRDPKAPGAFAKAMEAAWEGLDACGVPRPVACSGTSLERGRTQCSLSLECAQLPSGSAQMLAACAALGLDPWVVISSRPAPVPAGGGFAKVFACHVASARTMATMCMGFMLPHARGDSAMVQSKTTRRALAAMAFARAPDHGPLLGMELAAEMAKIFDGVAKEALGGAAGVMGALDQDAKTAAEILRGAGPALLAACASEPDALAAAQAAQARAAALLAVKTAKAAFDPAKAKKAMPPERKERLVSICKLLERNAADPGAGFELAAATRWLADEPNALCLPIKAQQSVLSTALRHHDHEAVALAERLGANIWIAAAQEGSSNACEWTVDMLWGPQPGELMDRLARMLAWGAHLDGAADPVGYALEKISLRPDGSDNPVRGALRSKIEAIVFESLLASRSENQGGEGSEGHGERKARRSGL